MGKLIRLQDKTPHVYYKESRDFQYIGRLYDLVLNYSKLNADLLYNLPISDNSDERLTELMSLTLGFKSTHVYNVKQLTALCTSFVEILKQKGTINGIKTACDVLLHAEGITEEAEVIVSEDEPYIINIFLPKALADTNLLKDLLNYILPAGVSCNLVRTVTVSVPAATQIGYIDYIKNYGRTTNQSMSKAARLDDPKRTGRIGTTNSYIMNAAVIGLGNKENINSTGEQDGTE